MSDGVEEIGATSPRARTRQRREKRVDGVVSFPFNTPHVEVACPECGETFEITVATNDPAGYSPTFGRCSVAGCDAFLKFRHTGAADARGQQTLEEWSA